MTFDPQASLAFLFLGGALACIIWAVEKLRGENKGWLAFNARCNRCDYFWTGVAPEDTDLNRLECSRCGAHDSSWYNFPD